MHASITQSSECMVLVAISQAAARWSLMYQWNQLVIVPVQFCISICENRCYFCWQLNVFFVVVVLVLLKFVPNSLFFLMKNVLCMS
jgi:hypothetical protein